MPILLVLGLGTALLLALAAGSPKPGSAPSASCDFDRGIAPALRLSLEHALVAEVDPGALELLAGSIPQFPKAQACLRARAEFLRQHPPPRAVPQLPGGACPPLDPGIPPQTATAVCNALALETDPTKLDEFAGTLRGTGFPVSAGLLEGKARLLRGPGASPGLPPGVLPMPAPPAAGPLGPPGPPGAPGAPGGIAVPPLPIPAGFPPGFPGVPGGGGVIPVGFPQGPSPASPAAPQPFIVTTATDPLRVREAPSLAARQIGDLPKGSTALVTGPEQNGFFPVLFQGGTGYSAVRDPVTGRVLLTPAGGQGMPGQVAGGRGAASALGAAYMLGAAEATRAAITLQRAILAHGCRHYDEPVVRRFQSAVRLPANGFYDARTQAALMQYLGQAAPASCFSPSGGPESPEFYWNPPGA